MFAARLKERIDIESPLEIQGEAGGIEKRWKCFLRGEPAEVITIRGQEFVAAMQSQYRMDIRVRIRWRCGIHNEQRIVWQGERYAIVQVMNGGPAREYIEMVCASGIGDTEDE